MCKAEMQNGKIKLWTDIHEVESSALDQLKNIAALPWMFKHVAVMPDVHYGKGATVGSVIAMKNAVSPAAVGVDIGCGMAAVKTSLHATDLPESLKDIRHQFERDVPVGFNSHDDGKRRVSDKINATNKALFDTFSSLHDKVSDLEKRAWQQLGTLGGGNHFIELCLDENDDVWLLLHSGSRNIGKSLAELHISVARGLAHNAELPDKDLAVFLSGTPEMEAYRRDLNWAQQYAFHNRATMLDLLKGSLRKFFPEIKFDTPITCHHNYVSEETHFGEDVIVTRKGAIYAGLGSLGLIPGSMGTRSYITRGLGNVESYASASHGAGRRMSRGAAKRAFNLNDLASQTTGVECRKDEGVLDEIPAAYKDVDEVMRNQSDLVEIVHTLKAVLCVKG
jgi:tRNA-splicing ligase RtcB